MRTLRSPKVWREDSRRFARSVLIATTKSIRTNLASTSANGILHTQQHCAHLLTPVPSSSSRTQLRTSIPSRQTILHFHTMADDSSYLSFLSDANKTPQNTSNTDTTGHTSTAESRTSKFDPTSSTAAIPEPLQSLQIQQIHYVSETDEAFEPILLTYYGDGLPNGEELGKSLGMKGANTREIEVMTVDEWDPRHQYEEVIGKVKDAGKHKGGNGEVKAYRVGLDRTRVEYYLLTVVERGLVGVKAKAVES